MQARHNNSKKTARTSFSPTWTIIVQSQGGIKCADASDVGFWDKVAKLRPRLRFLPHHEIKDPDKEKRADADLAERCDKGEFCSEVLLWARAMYPPLSPQICQHRRILPEPEAVTLIFEDAARDGVPAKLRELLLEKFEHCRP